MGLREVMLENFVIECTDGNIGAAACCMEILKSGDTKGITALQRMIEMNIKGEKIYLIWNDCCNRDIKKTIRVMHEKSKDEILDHIDLQKHDYRCVPFDFKENEDATV